MFGAAKAGPGHVKLSPEQFALVSRLVCRLTGINLKPGKEELVKARLNKRILQLKLSSFEDYLLYVQRRGNESERDAMLDALTTNKTSFFREKAHFDFLRQVIFPALKTQPKIRIWSAGCSTGEEPLSIAMLLREHLGGGGRRDIRLLATDLSRQVLEKARQGRFSQEAVEDIPKTLLKRYFQAETTAFGPRYRTRPRLLSMIAFARLNLMSRWPMKGPFQVIFCRNVMIYFDKPTQERLVGRLAGLLPPGGYLLIGHSESLTGLTHPYRFIQPAVYQKPLTKDSS